MNLMYVDASKGLSKCNELQADIKDDESEASPDHLPWNRRCFSRRFNDLEISIFRSSYSTYCPYYPDLLQRKWHTFRLLCRTFQFQTLPDKVPDKNIEIRMPDIYLWQWFVQHVDEVSEVDFQSELSPLWVDIHSIVIELQYQSLNLSYWTCSMIHRSYANAFRA